MHHVWLWWILIIQLIIWNHEPSSLYTQPTISFWYSKCEALIWDCWFIIDISSQDNPVYIWRVVAEKSSCCRSVEGFLTRMSYIVLDLVENIVIDWANCIAGNWVPIGQRQWVNDIDTSRQEEIEARIAQRAQERRALIAQLDYCAYIQEFARPNDRILAFDDS